MRCLTANDMGLMALAFSNVVLATGLSLDTFLALRDWRRRNKNAEDDR